MTAIGKNACGVRHQRVHDAHEHHHQGHPRERHANVLGAQHQEGFGKSSERHDGADPNDPPVSDGQSPDVGRRDVPFARLDVGSYRRLAHAEYQQQYGADRRQHREPEHRAKVIGEPQHRADRQHGSEHCTHRIQRLAQPIGGAAQVMRRNVGDERVTRRAADTLADAIDETREDDPSERRCQRKDWLGQGGKSVAEDREQLSPAQKIGQIAGKNLGD